jgi:hypothetical protein
VTTNHARYAAEIMALLRMMVRLGLDRTGGPAPVHHRPPPEVTNLLLRLAVPIPL